MQLILCTNIISMMIISIVNTFMQPARQYYVGFFCFTCAFCQPPYNLQNGPWATGQKHIQGGPKNWTIFKNV